MKGRPVVLFVDEDPDILAAAEMGLADQYEVHTTSSEEAAVFLLKSQQVDLVLLDARLEEEGGWEVFYRLKGAAPGVKVVLFTSCGGVDTAVAAVQGGFADVIVKPVGLEELKARLEKLLKAVRPGDGEGGAKKLFWHPSLEVPLVGVSPSMRGVIKKVSELADRPCTVLIWGESGTGKELVARALHGAGRYALKPFVALNCAAIPEGILERELFGSERGAYTGAVTSPGKIEYAGEGVLFLDEIGDLPLPLQGALLRVLDGHSFTRLGGNRPIPVKCRFIAATNRNLALEVKAGRFRADLYYRLNVVSIYLPPLKSRKEDIPHLIDFYLDFFKEKYGIERTLSPHQKEFLCSYDYPGNVRELKSMLESYVLTGELEFKSFGQLRPVEKGPGEEILPLAEFERRYVARVFELCGRDAKKAAKVLGITEKTVRKKLKECGEFTAGSPGKVAYIHPN